MRKHECVSNIRAGTTPLQTFEMDRDIDEYSKIIISYVQCGETVIEKRLPDVLHDDNVLWFRLTQEETLKLRAGQSVFIQLRAWSEEDEEACSSRIFKAGVLPSLNEKVIGGDEDGD